MHSSIVWNKNFDFRTCGTWNFFEILWYQKNDQNPVANPAEILGKKNSKIVKISNCHGVCNKIRLSTQSKHNSKYLSEYHNVFNTPGALQILTSKFGFTVALKPQRNWKNSKIVHFSHMNPHRYRKVHNSAIPIFWVILGIQDSIRKKFELFCCAQHNFLRTYQNHRYSNEII